MKRLLAMVIILAGVSAHAQEPLILTRTIDGSKVEVTLLADGKVRLTPVASPAVAMATRVGGINAPSEPNQAPPVNGGGGVTPVTPVQPVPVPTPVLPVTPVAPVPLVTPSAGTVPIYILIPVERVRIRTWWRRRLF